MQEKMVLVEVRSLDRIEEKLDNAIKKIDQIEKAKLDPPEEYFRINQGAKYTKMSRRKFEDLRKEGAFAFSQHGRHIVVAKSDLDNFINKNRIVKSIYR